MPDELHGPLGVALGAIIAAIRKTGISDDEVREWVEAALAVIK